MILKQWQLYYLGYYGGEIDGVFGTQTIAWARKQPKVRYVYAIDTNYVHMDIA